MSDLVKRLRGMASIGWNPIGDEAADEIEELTKQRDSLMKVCEDETGAIAKLTEERDRLREALEFYSDKKTYTTIRSFTAIDRDKGSRATEALNHKEG